MTKKTKTKEGFIKFNPSLLLLALLLVGIFVWRFQFLLEPKREYVSFKSTLINEPQVYGRWQYFNIEGYRVKASSDFVYEYGDILELRGQISEENRLNQPQISKVGKSNWQKSLFSIRSRLKEKIFLALPQPQASFLAGILIGAKEDLPKDFEENLRKTGTIHVVVVSGYNISVVGGFLASLSRFLNRRLATLLAIIGISLYTLLVGADPPAIRAAIMGSLAFSAVIFGRQRVSGYSLILAAAVMILLSPRIIGSISFQLSFLASGGIIIFQDKLLKIVKVLPRPFNEDLATTLAAQILVIPIIFYHFGSVSLLSPVVNSLVLWVIPLSTIGGFIFLLVSLVVWPLALVISWILWALLSIFIFVVATFAKFSFAYLQFEPGNWLPLVGFYLVLLAVLHYFKYVREPKTA